MPLTKQQIEEFDNLAGVSTPTPTNSIGTAGINRVKELKALRESNTSDSQTEPSTINNLLAGYKEKVVEPLQEFSTGFAKRGLVNPAQNIAKGVAEVATLGKADTSNFGLPKEQLETKTPIESLGGVVGEVAPYLLPGGQIKSLPLATKVGVRLLTNTGIGAAQTGDIKKGLGIGIGGEIIGGLSKPMSNVGKLLYKEFSIPLSKAEAKLLQSYKANEPFLKRVGNAIFSEKSKAPNIASETAFNKGIFGTESMIGVQSKKASQKIWQGIVKPALKTHDEKVNVPELFNKARTQIISENPELSRQKSLLKGLESIQDDYTGVENVSLEKLQELKQGWDKFVPEKAFRGESVAGAVNEVRKTLGDISRNTVHSVIDDPIVKQAYTDYGNLIGLQEWGQKAMTGSKFKGGAGSFISALKDTLLIPVSTIGGQVIYKTSNGIKFIGAPGLKLLSDLITEESQP